MIGDRLVSVLVPGGPPPLDQLEPDEAPANDNAPVSENQPIRDLAYSQLQGRIPTAQQLGSVSQLQADWICAMDGEMTHRLLKATDAEINAHLLGRKNVRGLLAYDADTIDDFNTARAIDQARFERDLGFNQPYQAKMPA